MTLIFGLITNNKVINNLCVCFSSLGQDVLEELQSSALQDSFLLRDGVAVVGELLLQLLQLLQVLADLLETLRHRSEPATGGNRRRRRSNEKLQFGQLQNRLKCAKYRMTEKEKGGESWWRDTGGLTISAAGPRRRWAGHQCRRSAAAASTRAAPRRSGRRSAPGRCSGGRSAGPPHPDKTGETPPQEERNAFRFFFLNFRGTASLLQKVAHQPSGSEGG